MTRTTAPIVNVTALIGSLHGRGRDYTNARNAVIAHALVTGVKGSVIAAESKVDKGDVSRINKRLTELKEAKGTGSKAMRDAYAGIVALAPRDLNVDAFATLATAVSLGKWLTRDKSATGAAGGAAADKGQGSTVSTVTAAGEGESDDMLATIHDYLVSAPDFAAALAVVKAAIESAEREVAETAAAADAA